jgi:aryl-alcohol dehydrogenase-like predicted oxidoreductase
MKTIPFGTTDLRVTNLCLGTMQFGWTADEAASVEVMDAFVEAGGNFIDTADIYSRWWPGNPGGVSEEIIGRWMKARGNRNSLTLATKLRGQMWDGPDGEGLGRAHITRAIEDSLRRLQVETIDLYQTHWPDDAVPQEKTFAVFGELIAAGKVRYIGLSNYQTGQMEEALRLAEQKSLPRFVSLQPHYNLVWREEFESKKMQFCQTNSVAVIPYSPLEGGFLSGKYKRGGQLPNTPRAYTNRKFMTDDGFAVVEALESIAAEKRVSVSAVALAWLLHRPSVTAPIIGANSPAQLADLLPAADLKLSAEDMRRLNEVSEPFTFVNPA